MRKPIEKTGFAPHASNASGGRALAELIANTGLTLAIAVTAIVLTAGAARAEVADGVIGNEGGVFAVALVLGIVFIGIGSLPLTGSRPKKR